MRLRMASAGFVIASVLLAIVVPLIAQRGEATFFFLPVAGLLVAFRFLVRGQPASGHYILIGASSLLVILPSVGFALAAVGH